MRRLIVALAVVAAVLAVRFFRKSPASPPQATETETAQIDARVKEELAGRMDLYRDALLSGDSVAFMSMYTSDARVFWPGMNFDRDGLQAFAAEFFQTTTWTGYDAAVVDLFVHGDAAYAIYEVSETFQTEGQGPGSEIWNCFTRWEKEDDVWKVDRDVCGPRDAPPEG